jgi:undecaprenyl pyrophosphate synthase
MYDTENKGFIARIIKRLLAWLRSLVITILAQGQVPRHVAFIMDGNRRYAKRHHVANITGHSAGFSTLQKVCFPVMQERRGSIEERERELIKI